MSTTPIGTARRPAYDARAVASLLLLGTLALAPVSVVLGLVGLRGTRRGARRGRWCAVLGVVGGVVLTGLLAAGAVVRPWVEPPVVDPLDEVRSGDCVDVDRAEAGLRVEVDERPCDAEHDAEVVHRGTFDSYLVRRFDDVWAHQFCTTFAAEHLASAFLSGRYTLSVILIGDPTGPAEGQEFLCLTQRADDEKLSHRIGVDV